MSWRTVVITSRCKLDYKMGFMVVRAEEIKKVFLDEIAVLLIENPVELGKYADLTVQFAPFELNRKSLLTKLYSSLEHKALLAENYMQTGNLLAESASLHGFRVLLIESTSQIMLKNVNRYTVDDDLCEF